MSTAPRSDGGATPSGRAETPPPPVAADQSPRPPVGRLARVLRAVPGLAILAGCYLAGEFLKQRLGLIVPGSVLGLFLLLALLGAGVVRADWVEEASRLLLTWMPLFFVPIYVNATADRVLWREWGVVMAGTLAVTVMLLWVFVGRLAQRVLARPDGKDAP